MNGRSAVVDRELYALLGQQEAWRLGHTRERPDLFGRDFSGWDFSCEDLTGALLTRARLVGANAEGGLLSGAVLDGADLTECNLAHAELTGALLRGATLHGADLTGACLDDAVLENANMSSVCLAGADCCNADMRGANLQGAYLGSAMLRGADLRGASLLGAAWGTASGDPEVDLSLTRIAGTVFAEGLGVPCQPDLARRILELLNGGARVRDRAPFSVTEEHITTWTVQAAAEGERLGRTVGTHVAAALLWHHAYGYVPDLNGDIRVVMRFLHAAVAERRS